LVSEVLTELPPLALALEDFVDLEAGAADFDVVIRMLGRPNSVGSFKRVASFARLGSLNGRARGMLTQVIGGGNRRLGKCHHRGEHDESGFGGRYLHECGIGCDVENWM
jgi:hypothetical protein